MPRWTKAAREKHSELISAWKPWESSTGAKTPEGKAISSQNARKKLTPEEQELKDIDAILIAVKKQHREILELLKKKGIYMY